MLVPAARADDGEQLASTIASSWSARQDRSGAFADYSRGTSFEYAESILGYGLLEESVRAHDPAMKRSALKALAFAADPPPGRIDGVFQHMALAGAYDFARDHRIATGPALARALRRMGPFWIGTHQRYMNKYLVEAVSVLDLLHSGLRSNLPGSFLARRAWARRNVMRLLGHAVNQAARASNSHVAMLSDPPDDPPAYHALSLGMLARCIQLLGPGAPRSAMPLLRRMANASWEFMGPDGDLAYFGRSQEQAWTLAMTAYGARVAALGAQAGDAARYRGLADRALGRLRDVYSGGPGGIWITPELRDARGGLQGMDAYADGAAYTGLTLVALEWAHEAGGDGSVAPLASDAPGSYILDRGRSRFAVVRTANTWFAVKAARSAVRDLRYDAGLVSMKHEDAGGWHDVVHLRPLSMRGADSAGPVLHAGTELAFPVGRAMHLVPGGVVVSGTFATASGRTVRRAVFTYRADGDCVTLEFDTRAGERFNYSSFLPGGAPMPGGVHGGGSSVSFDPAPSEVRIEGGYSSAEDRRLVRARAMLVAQGGTARVVTCPAA